MKFDVSRYAGKNVTITAYVLTEDSKIRMGLETSSSTQLLEADAKEDWTELSVNYTLPEDAPAAYIYIETDGNADFYVDDISVVINEDGAAVEETGEGDGSNASGNEENAAKPQNVSTVLIAAGVLIAGIGGFCWWKSRKRRGRS